MSIYCTKCETENSEDAVDCLRCGHLLNLIDPRPNVMSKPVIDATWIDNERNRVERELHRANDRARLSAEIAKLEEMALPTAIQGPLGLETLFVCPQCQGHMVPQCTNLGRMCPLCNLNLDAHFAALRRRIEDKQDELSRLSGLPAVNAQDRIAGIAGFVIAFVMFTGLIFILLVIIGGL